MNAEEIRTTVTREEAKGIPSQARDFWLREIAAQLAELNQHLKAMRGSTPVPPISISVPAGTTVTPTGGVVER